MYIGHNLINQVIIYEAIEIDYITSGYDVPDAIVNTLSNLHSMLEVEYMLHYDSLMNFVCDSGTEN